MRVYIKIENTKSLRFYQLLQQCDTATYPMKDYGAFEWAVGEDYEAQWKALGHNHRLEHGHMGQRWVRDIDDTEYFMEVMTLDQLHARLIPYADVCWTLKIQQDAFIIEEQTE